MDYLVRRYEISERRACKLARQHRSTQRYAAMHGDDPRPVVVATGYPGYLADPMDPAGAPGEEPIYPEPVYERPIDERPIYEEPVYEEPVHRRSTFDDLTAAERMAGRDDDGEDVRRVAERVAGPDGLCDVVAGTAQAVGRIPVTIVGGFVRFTVDSGSACVEGARATAGLLGRLMPCGRRKARGRLRT